MKKIKLDISHLKNLFVETFANGGLVCESLSREVF